jgi:hypothetical protein
MHDTPAANKYSVVNFDVARKQHIVCQDDAIGNSRVMAEVRAYHEQIIRPNNSIRAFLCAPMDCAVFAYDVVIPNLDT